MCYFSRIIVSVAALLFLAFYSSTYVEHRAAAHLLFIDRCSLCFILPNFPLDAQCALLDYLLVATGLVNYTAMCHLPSVIQVLPVLRSTSVEEPKKRVSGPLLQTSLITFALCMNESKHGYFAQADYLFIFDSEATQEEALLLLQPAVEA